MNQKVGNYPGVTVDRRAGSIKLPSGEKVTLIDLPGTYSLSSKSIEEQVVQNILLNPKENDYPDLAVLVVDATNLQRNLFLATQVMDLGIPCVLALNMVDVLENDGSTLNLEQLKQRLNIPVVSISSKTGKGMDDLLQMMGEEVQPTEKPFVEVASFGGKTLETFMSRYQLENTYASFKILNNLTQLHHWRDKISAFQPVLDEHHYLTSKAELDEIGRRHAKLKGIVKGVVTSPEANKEARRTAKIDRWTTHPILGTLIFLLVFFTVFQAIFTVASYPMDWIHEGVIWLGGQVSNLLPAGMFNDFIADGVFAGLAGVLIFVPQIMILFGLIALLEESGYLSRVSFLTDGLLKKFGMNGRSVVPLVGGFACAIPAIMSARTIENKKERFITIFITPLMSCSARLPVYVFLVSFIVPNDYLLGFISTQGLAMMGLYLLGIFVSLIIAFVLNRYLKDKNPSSFILELPNYKTPQIKNALLAMVNKGRVFVMQAGKIILIASMILWVLSYFGPGSDMQRIEEKYSNPEYTVGLTEDEIAKKRSSEELEKSYLGHIGKAIEPVFRPLGYDWKTSIAVLASFAAREVFVGTMATIYSVEESMEGEKGLKAIKFSYATAFSLLIFYVFALQCMSTLAIVKQETGSWKVVFGQFILFTGLAYLFAFLVYQTQ